jgi:hypothetical protein
MAVGKGDAVALDCAMVAEGLPAYIGKMSEKRSVNSTIAVTEAFSPFGLEIKSQKRIGDELFLVYRVL